jgi:hypothetical protein
MDILGMFWLFILAIFVIPGKRFAKSTKRKGEQENAEGTPSLSRQGLTITMSKTLSSFPSVDHVAWSLACGCCIEDITLSQQSNGQQFT